MSTDTLIQTEADMVEDFLPQEGMLRVGDHFPQFSLTAVLSNNEKDAFQVVTNENYKGKWLVVFAWPKDFTFVCPTELVEFNRLYDEFKDRDAEVLGLSVDSDYVHLNWRKSHPDLQDIKFPMLSDITRELSFKCGILDTKGGVAQRATFIVDPDSVVQFAMMTPMKVGRNPTEVLRILDAIQTEGLCACGWETGDENL